MVKNIEHPKRTTSSPMKGDEHSRHFQRGFPPVPQPWRPSLAARWCQGQRARIRHFHFSGCKLLILLRITIWAEEFFHGGVDLNPLSTVRSPQSRVVSCSVWCRGGDELVNRSYRDRAADDLGHRDVTRNLSRELWMDSASEIASWFQEVKVETLRWNDRRYVFIY